MTEPQKKVFGCTSCGACCAHVRSILKKIELVEEDKGFDFKVKPDGSCGHLIPITRNDGAPGLGCAVYDSRPIICRIDRNIPTNMTPDEYFSVTARLCNNLQVFHGVPDTYRLQVELRNQRRIRPSPATFYVVTKIILCFLVTCALIHQYLDAFAPIVQGQRQCRATRRNTHQGTLKSLVHQRIWVKFLQKVCDFLRIWRSFHADHP